MLVNQAIGGINGGDPSATAFPINYRIDWIRVHAWSNETAYTLTVNGGVGSGPYIPGTQASITALMPLAGQVFDKWVVNSGSPAIDSMSAASAILTMPSGDIQVTAAYKAQGDKVIRFNELINRIQKENFIQTVEIYNVSGMLVKKGLLQAIIGNKPGFISLSPGAYFARISPVKPDVGNAAIKTLMITR
jgi:hypothetical protein